jgi:septum site-determining protein MinD
MAGHIISVIGGKGGVGKSLVAANLAFAYSMEARQKSLLLDFDQRALGDLNIITGMRGKKTLKELSEFSGAVDPRTLQMFLTSHKAGVSYVPMATDRVSAEQINAGNLGKFIKTIPKFFPVTIIDVGNELNDLALKALEHSTLIFVITSPDLIAINQSKKLLDELTTRMFPKEMTQVILNQYQKGHPINPELVGRKLGRSVFSTIQRDDNSCINALNRSMPVVLVAKSSPFAEGVIGSIRKLRQQNLLKKLERLNKSSIQSNVVKFPSGAKAGGASTGNQWVDLKLRIHRALVEEMDLKKKTDDSDPNARIIMREQTKKMVVDLLNKDDTKAILKTREDMNRIVKEILDEALGLGPLEDLLSDKTVSEIMVVGHDKIYYEQSGKNKLSDVTFSSERQVLNVIERIVAPIGRRIDEKTPYVDARLRDGSRVHAIIPPCAIDGSTVTIRKFPENRLTYKDLVKFGSMTQEMADFLRIAVEAHKNIVVSGGTGSGKTTLINVLGSFIPANERIITVEDSAELDLPQDHIVRLETRPPSLEGDGEITIRTLVKQTLRMKPDRIIVGECRGGEALDMLQAMNTGHDGSMTTIHSNTPRDCMSRIETLVQYSGAPLSPKAIKEMASSAIHLIVQQTRLEDGSRKVMNITEVGGMQGDVITLQDIFVYQQEGINKKGKIEGKFQSTGFIPKFVEVLEKKGYKIPRGIFKN